LDCVTSKEFNKASSTWNDPPTTCLKEYKTELENCKGAFYELNDKFTNPDPDNAETFGAVAIAGGFTNTGDKNYYFVLPDDEKPKGMKNTYPVHPLNCKVCTNMLKSLTKCALPIKVTDVNDPGTWFDDKLKAFNKCVADLDSPADRETAR
jgi:hypothetical protein